MTYSEVCESLTALGGEFHRRGWVLGTSGNFSSLLSRDPLRIAITESSVDKSRLHPGQILQVDSSGSIATGVAGKPSAETLIHVAIFQERDAGAVLHTHSVWSTTLSDYHNGQGGFFIEGYEMLKGLNGVSTHEHREWIPILENNQDIPALSAEAVRLLREHKHIHGFLIRRHGLYTWGTDLTEALRHVEILEFLLEAVGRRQMMEPQH